MLYIGMYVNIFLYILQRGYCVCLESYQTISVQVQSECTDECDDIGLCGRAGSNSQSYVSVYRTAAGKISFYFIKS